MKVHHSGHHQTYTDKLNAALVELASLAPELATVPIAKLLERLPEVPEKVRGAIRNNGGGYVNHEFFFNAMAPGQGGVPTGALAAAITATWGSFDAFKEAFTNAALGCFGSGWVWLISDAADGGKLKIVSSANQETPASDPTKKPLVVIDLWEHAYYLKFQNKRAAWIAAWWNVVSWPVVAARFA